MRVILVTWTINLCLSYMDLGHLIETQRYFPTPTPKIHILLDCVWLHQVIGLRGWADLSSLSALRSISSLMALYFLSLSLSLKNTVSPYGAIILSWTSLEKKALQPNPHRQSAVLKAFPVLWSKFDIIWLTLTCHQSSKFSSVTTTTRPGNFCIIRVTICQDEIDGSLPRSSEKEAAPQPRPLVSVTIISWPQELLTTILASSSSRCQWVFVTNVSVLRWHD